MLNNQVFEDIHTACNGLSGRVTIHRDNSVFYTIDGIVYKQSQLPSDVDWLFVVFNSSAYFIYNNDCSICYISLDGEEWIKEHELLNLTIRNKFIR